MAIYDHTNFIKDVKPVRAQDVRPFMPIQFVYTTEKGRVNQRMAIPMYRNRDLDILHSLDLRHVSPEHVLEIYEVASDRQIIGKQFDKQAGLINFVPEPDPIEQNKLRAFYDQHIKTHPELPNAYRTFKIDSMSGTRYVKYVSPLRNQ